MALSRTPAETADLRYRRAVKKLTRFIKDWLYLIIAAGAVAALIGADASYWNYTYNDSDGYMRALRVWHWLSGSSRSPKATIRSEKFCIGPARWTFSGL